MILQALTKLYEDLADQGKLAREGWANAKISYALCIDRDGKLLQIVSLQQEELSGKKTVLRPRAMELPAAVKRTAGVLPNFLWDNSAYLLGIDGKGKPERSRECFEAAKDLHHELLDPTESENAQAILAFFDNWDPKEAAEHPAVRDNYDELCKGANLVFRVNGRFAQEDEAIRGAWQAHYDTDDGEWMQCLITGKNESVMLTHPSISGVRDAQSSGAAIVSFNAPAFCSYGREQGLNAPVGKYAAFAYTSALNYLLADRPNVTFIGDTTVVCWAEGAQEQYQAFAMDALFNAGGAMNALFGNENTTLSEADVRATVKKLAEGEPCKEYDLDPNRPFYILGLAPNAARISIRFFLRDSFGRFMNNVNDHNERMEIVRPSYDQNETLPIWAMLRETVNLNSRDKSPSPVMAGATVRAILTGGRYPASLLENAMLRIRAERNVTRGRAAILKAYYLRNEHTDCPKEVLTVALNEESRNIPYTLGRLFAVYEAAQQAANPGINATIKDRFFNSAAATPATIFPILANLYQKHLRKIDAKGYAVNLDKQVAALKAVLGEEYPARLTLPQQGSFDLGYYHQTQKRYANKEEK